MPSTSFTRELQVNADTEATWRALTDVPVVVSWVSVVDDVRELGYLELYTAVLMDRIGPFKLRAELEIDVSEVEPGRRMRLRASGEDRQVSSRIGIDATLELAGLDGGGSTVSVNGRYEVVGRVATLGAGMIRQKATKILDEFFHHACAALGET